MRRRWSCAAAAALALWSPGVWANPDPVTVTYEATALGADRWQYTYTVANASLNQAVDEFTLWFREDWYDHLALATLDPPAAAWNELLAQPDPLLADAGFYDALALTAGIATGDSVSGFAVTFDWLGPGSPGAQPFDIVDPQTFQPVYSGTTLPEPATAILLGLLAAVTRRSRR